MKRLAARFLLFVALSATALMATPPGTTWYLSGVRFTDGTTASGSFVYDGTTYSSINITTSAGAHYIAKHQFQQPSSPFLRLVTLASGDLTNTPYLVLNFGNNLPDAGGTVQVVLSGVPDEFTCSNAGCTFTSPGRTLAAGAVTTVSPVSSAPALSGAGMALAALLLAGSAFVMMRNLPAHCA